MEVRPLHLFPSVPFLDDPASYLSLLLLEFHRLPYPLDLCMEEVMLIASSLWSGEVSPILSSFSFDEGTYEPAFVVNPAL